MKKIFEKYFGESEISSKRINVALFIVFWFTLALVRSFTTWVTNDTAADHAMEWAMYIIIAGTFGVAAVDIFRRKTAPVEPVPQPEPEVKPEPVKPTPKPKPQISAADVQLDFIKRHEGCKLTAYKCPAGVWTIGYGSTTYPDGRKVQKGDKITQEDAQRMLEWEVRNRLTQMKLPDWITYPQRTAIVSWHYNCGHGAWMKSKLRQLILAKADNEAIYKQWTTTYITGGGKRLPGLVRRRKEEAELYTTQAFNLIG